MDLTPVESKGFKANTPFNVEIMRDQSTGRIMILIDPTTLLPADHPKTVTGGGNARVAYRAHGSEKIRVDGQDFGLAVDMYHLKRKSVDL